MSPLGPIYVGDKPPGQSQSLLDQADAATSDIVNIQLERACEVVESERASIERLVQLLLERDTIEADDIQKCFGMISMPSLNELQSPAVS